MEAKLAAWKKKKQEEAERKKQQELLKKQVSIKQTLRGKQVTLTNKRPKATPTLKTQPVKGIKRPAPSSNADKILDQAKATRLIAEESDLLAAKSTIDRLLSQEEKSNSTQVSNANESSLSKPLQATCSSPHSESNLTEEYKNLGFSSASSSARSSLSSLTGVVPVQVKSASISRRVSMPHSRPTTPHNLSQRRASVSSFQPSRSVVGPQRVLATEQQSDSEDSCTEQSMPLQAQNDVATPHISRRRSLVRFRRLSSTNQEAGPTCSSGKWTPDDFIFLDKKLGYGKFGYVYLAQARAPPHIEVAMKVSTKRQCDGAELLSIKVESSLQSRLYHPNILRFYGWFQCEPLLYFILEYAPRGSLRELLSQQPDKYFNEAEAATYLYQVTLALQYLHERHIMHRDIKPENILLGRNGEVKLADFGLASHAPPPHHRRRTYCGTPEYMSPEIFCCKDYTKETDLWSLGILAHELLLGYTPFQGESIQDQVEDWFTSTSRSFPSLESANHISALAKDFIHGLLQPVESRRSLQKTLQHAWLCRPTV